MARPASLLDQIARRFALVGLTDDESTATSIALDPLPRNSPAGVAPRGSLMLSGLAVRSFRNSIELPFSIERAEDWEAGDGIRKAPASVAQWSLVQSGFACSLAASRTRTCPKENFMSANLSVSETVLEDLVVAVLAVNNYSLEKAFSLVSAIRAEGLADLTKLSKWEVPEIAPRLSRAGYDRGVFLNTLIAQRLSSLGAYASELGFAVFEKKIRSSETDEVQTCLLPVKGVGPKVVENFLLLRESSK